MESDVTAIVSPQLAVSHQARCSWTDEAGKRRQETETFRNLDLAENPLLSTKLKFRRPAPISFRTPASQSARIMDNGAIRLTAPSRNGQRSVAALSE
jgi:hypothetical protein